LIDDARPFSTGGSKTAALECGTYAVGPLCVWADDSVLVIVQYANEQGTLEDLGSAMPVIVHGMSGE
jgi:hypothetical protein